AGADREGSDALLALRAGGGEGDGAFLAPPGLRLLAGPAGDAAALEDRVELVGRVRTAVPVEGQAAADCRLERLGDRRHARVGDRRGRALPLPREHLDRRAARER